MRHIREYKTGVFAFLYLAPHLHIINKSCTYLFNNKYTKSNKSKLEGVNPHYSNGSADAYRTIMISTIISMHSLIQSRFKKYKYISEYNTIELYTYVIIILHRVYVIVCHV